MRVVVVASERSYVSGELAHAAKRLDVELVFVTDRCHVLAEKWPANAIAVDFRKPDRAAAKVHELVDGLVAALGTDEPTAIVAEAIGHRFAIPSSTAGAAARAADKLSTRQLLTAAGARQPQYTALSLNDDLRVPLGFDFPVVVKPRCLTASRGVILARDQSELTKAITLLGEILSDPDIRGRFGELAESLVVEEFVAGPEVALDGVFIGGALEVLAIFDKPRPLEGPHFAESFYVTPTKQPAAVKDEIAAACRVAASALGLSEGPIHAELRLADAGPVVLEIAARSIGGLCGRMLRHARGRSIAELVLANLCGIELEPHPDQPMAAGVAMLAPPSSGVFVEMHGVARAAAVVGIESIEITAHRGQVVNPVPVGGDTIGFVFATGATSRDVTDSLERADSLLTAELKPLL